MSLSVLVLKDVRPVLVLRWVGYVDPLPVAVGETGVSEPASIRLLGHRDPFTI